jgi:hypothetical protein
MFGVGLVASAIPRRILRGVRESCVSSTPPAWRKTEGKGSDGDFYYGEQVSVDGMRFQCR